MRRLLAFAAVGWLVLALAPAVLADDPSPRPALCRLGAARRAGGGSTCGWCARPRGHRHLRRAVRSEINADPLMPYAVGALVTGIALAVVGVVAMRLVGRRAGARLAPERPDAWWVCPACQSVNAEGRPACYACHASRGAPAAGTPEPMLMRRAD